MKSRNRIVAFILVVLVAAGVIGTTVTGISKDISLGLDLQGGFEVLYEVTPIDDTQKVDRSLMEGTVRTLNDRVNRLGISETVIDIEGEDRIRVQLAGVENQEEAREMLATSARLSFRDVNDTELLDGADVKEGSAKQDFHPDSNKVIVTLKLKDANKFGDVTTDVMNLGLPNNLLVIWMDFIEGEDSFEAESTKEEPKYVSAASVGQPLYTTDVMIEGNFTVEEAQRLRDVINSGSLPVHMEELYSTTVGAQFGEKALHQTVFAGFVGIAIIFIFMIAVYRLPGVIATVNLSIYIFLILLVFKLMNGVLTLPGIAALILGVGMAVDANVLTFERIKEELRLGKSTKASFKTGGKNALVTIIDANITTLLAAAVLFMFGTSSIKGFATMLIVSILVSFLTAVYGTRLLLGLWVKSGFLDNKIGWFSVKASDIREISSKEEIEPTLFNKTFNIIKHRKKIFTFSITVLIIGTISLLVFQLNPGIDFTSGTRVEVMSDNALTSEEISKSLETLELEAKSIVLSGEKNEIGVVRYDKVLPDDKVDELKGFYEEKYGYVPNISIVSPVVGQELVKNAVYALMIASIGMILYLTLRFEITFALTGIVTLLHDVFFILVILSITRIEFDITIVAAILTIIGYSINNTIVVFDRIRENIRAKNKLIKSKEELAKIVNDSLVQTFIRSINTTITTLVAVLAFLFLGAGSITGFAIALAIGLVAGAYSSLFLASQLWLVWRGRNLKEKPIDFRKKQRVEGPQV